MQDACEASNSNVYLNQLQDRKCTCIVTLRSVCADIAGVNKQYVTYSVCLSVALRTQHEMCMRRTVICTLSGSIIFYQVLGCDHASWNVG